MRRMKTSGLVLLVFIPYLLTTCSKSSSTNETEQPDPPPPPPATQPVPGMLDYGDSVIYAQWLPNGKDQLIAPKEPGVDGKYIAWPEGLAIDEKTGIINIKLSQHGLKFTIGFITLSINDTTIIELTISGVNYRSGVHVLQNNDTLSIPYYNETISLTGLLGLSDDNDYPPDSPDGSGGGNSRAEFDDGHDDDNGNGYADEPPLGQRANEQRLRVRTTSGVINLKKSIVDGLFGANPQNGDNKEITIYYRLNDYSEKALQSITVKVYYYEYEGDIPGEVLNSVKQQMHNDQARASGKIGLLESKPRPPQIIICSFSGSRSSVY